MTVGFNLADATKKQAAANPDTDFAIIDDNSIDAKNVKPITFDTSQAAFLAGYAAASLLEDRHRRHLRWHADPDRHDLHGRLRGRREVLQRAEEKDVKVVGWDVDSQKGSFTGGFEAGTQAKTVAQSLIDQDADVIMPVGGPIYQSAAEAIKDSNNGPC